MGCTQEGRQHMRCPHCAGIEDRVIESRQNATGSAIRRRRECFKCGYRFTSYEHIVEKKLKVVKRDGRREPFDLEKLEIGITKSLEKRPVSEKTIEEMLHNIEDEAILKASSNNEISTEMIGQMVLEKLYDVDRVAYVRFASVYRMFDKVEEFIQAIEDLANSSSTS